MMFRERREREWEDYAILIDIYRRGKDLLLGQVIGEKYFKLMEFQLDPNVDFRIFERVFVGHGRRKIRKFSRFLSFNELTDKAKRNLPVAIEKLILMDEDKWIEFFNKAGPITHRGHSLELLPSIGKKTVVRIIEEREERPFKSYKDFKERLGIDPVHILRDKLVEEITGRSQYNILLEWSRRWAALGE